MMIVRTNEMGNNIKFIFSFAVVANMVAKMVTTLFDIGNIYYLNYFIWFIIIFWSLYNGVIISKSKAFIGVLITISIAFSLFNRQRVYGDGLEDIVQNILCGVILLFGVTMKYKETLDEDDVIYVFKLFRLCGIIATIYTIFNQGVELFSILTRNSNSYYSWMITSFFGQRNIFAEFCMLCLFATFYLWIKKRDRFNLALIIVFSLEIIATQSRAALLGIVCFFGMYIYFNTKRQWILVAFMFLFVLLLTGIIDISEIVERTVSKFYHATNRGVDSGSLRLMGWEAGIENVINNRSFLFGYGAGSESSFVRDLIGVESFHNMYIDALFEGGLFFAGIIIREMWKSYKTVSKQYFGFERNCWRALIIAFFVHGMFESGNMLYRVNYFSIMSTILIIFIPRCLEEKKNEYVHYD